MHKPRKCKVPNKVNTKRPTSRHTIIKTPNVKDKENLKNRNRNALGYLKGSFHKLSADFSTETLHVRIDRYGIF